MATRRLTAACDAVLAPLGINIGQHFVLRTIFDRTSVSLTELGRLTELDRSTVGRNVRVLEGLGVVVTARGDTDQREAVVSVTTAGPALLEEAEPLWDRAQADTASRLDPDGLSALRTTLDAI